MPSSARKKKRCPSSSGRRGSGDRRPPTRGGRQTRWHESTCFFFNDTATPEIYTLSLHDALPIFQAPAAFARMNVTRAVSRMVWPFCWKVSVAGRSEEHTSELQSRENLVCRL